MGNPTGYQLDAGMTAASRTALVAVFAAGSIHASRR
jgi:hypothetical protein